MTFRNRLLLAYASVWLLIFGLAVGVASWSLTRGLYTWVEGILLHDLEELVTLYSSNQTGSARSDQGSPNTGGIFVSLYTLQGQAILVPPDSPSLPVEVVAAASSTPQIYREATSRAAYRLAPPGIVFVVAQNTQYIDGLAVQVRTALLQSLIILLPIGFLVVLLLGRLSVKPLQYAALAIQKRSPDNLSVVTYPGPSDELGAIVQQVNTLLAALDESKKRERAFLAEVSHELRTPLTALNGYLERINKNPHEAEAREGARRTAAHLTRLVADLLALARGEAQRSVNMHIVNLLEVARQCTAEYPGVGLVGDCTEVLGDPDRLLQLARNLIANAVRAAGRPEGVEVTLTSQNAEACLLVHDDGPGIDPEVLPRLFERFARGPQGGTGLGLAIARQIAEAHGGRIEVNSQPGSTQFAVYLPLFNEDENEIL